jgi:hypothetical protein
MSKEEWDAVIAVNLTGPFLAAREFAAGAIGAENDGGVIVNISSSARNGYVFQSNYSAAKAGIAADTVVWAKELAKHQIRVGAIAPGVVHTKILDSVPKDLLDDLISKVVRPCPYPCPCLCRVHVRVCIERLCPHLVSLSVSLSLSLYASAPWHLSVSLSLSARGCALYVALSVSESRGSKTGVAAIEDAFRFNQHPPPVQAALKRLRNSEEI